MTIIKQIYESKIAEDTKTTSSIELNRKINQLAIATTSLPEDFEDVTDLFFETCNFSNYII